MGISKPAQDLFFPSPRQFRKTCLPQEFPFRIPIMEYIWDNPTSAIVFQKLIKCCKLFFLKNSMLIMSNLECSEDEWYFCNIDNASGFHRYREVDIGRIKHKIWITNGFSINTNVNSALSSFISTFFPKIYRYDINELEICHQNISYEELKLLATGVNKCDLFIVYVKYVNDEPVPLESIVQLFSNCKRFYMYFDETSVNSSCKRYDAFIDACITIKKVELYFCETGFSIPTFYQHLKKRKSRALFDIWHYSLNLDDIIDVIFQTPTFQFVPPVIGYSGIDDEKYKRIKEIQKIEALKYQ